ncbi:2-octaprenyl-6-methoxyphenyl hydroxylase [Pseudomonas stutzeri]|uniref:2-octaprenyl-6-methoxyphenyl hydroxylase n=1 Tax=Stutzerimonas stutzeri TaxID=316 RepID=UPI00210C7991|nr:2-octaprenyl-6-methoxyphenyl hydroxylase [Stutzerimonas stutzeri]MCQ4311525.1 2-octaprenyl-6-methoxyphenyl hydroxylase [Stutzerimonas stutzeri]
MGTLAIVGGGLVGASLALALQKGAKEYGWTIELIEPFEPGNEYQPSYDARSTALSYGTRLIYQRLGVWGRIAERAQPITHIHVSDRGRAGATRLDASTEQVPALGYVVENAWIGHCLWQALDDEVVVRHCPAEVERMQASAGGYQLTLTDGKQLDCDLAVLADGGRSALREQLGIEIKRTPYDQSALIANVTPGKPHGGQAFERFTDEGPMALLPLQDNRCALVWTRPEQDAARLVALPEAEFLDELQQAFGYRLGGFQQVGARHLYPLMLIEADEQVRSGLVVLGNAAHSLHPIAGQGYNLSLRDTEALASMLLSSPQRLGELGVLQVYHRRQRSDQRLTVGFSDQLTQLFGESGRLAIAGRNLGLVALDLLPPAKKWFARQAMGLGVRKL